MSVLPIQLLTAQTPSLPALRLVETGRIDVDTYVLSRIGTIVLGPDGTLAVGQPQDHEVLLFSQQGRKAGKFGAKGEGPGEMKAQTGFGWSGNRYWLYDNQLNRFTEFDGKGALVKTTPLALPATHGTPPTSYSFGQGTSGAQMLAAATTMGDQTTPGGRTRIVQRDISGDRESPVTAVPTDKCRIAFAGGIATIPLCPQAQWAYSPEGDRVVLAEMIDVSKGTYRLSGISASGSAIFSRTFSAPTRRVSAARIDTIWTQYAKSNAAAHAALKSAGVTISPIPGVLSRLVVVNQGISWIQLSRDPAVQKEAIWRGYSANGTPLGTVSLPGGSRIAAGDGSTLVVISQDEEGEETIIRYRIVK